LLSLLPSFLENGEIKCAAIIEVEDNSSQHDSNNEGLPEGAPTGGLRSIPIVEIETRRSSGIHCKMEVSSTTALLVEATWTMLLFPQYSWKYQNQDW
jgi:hypothetical protein